MGWLSFFSADRARSFCEFTATSRVDALLKLLSHWEPLSAAVNLNVSTYSQAA
jgi:hypothetical protein